MKMYLGSWVLVPELRHYEKGAYVISETDGEIWFEIDCNADGQGGMTKIYQVYQRAE